MIHYREEHKGTRLNWGEIAGPLLAQRGGKTKDDFSLRWGEILEMDMAGDYFATIEQVWRSSTDESVLSIVPDHWQACQQTLCRARAPVFDRYGLPRDPRDPRDPREFVDASNGALLSHTSVSDSITTVNDALIPVDVFGAISLAADKAHLLPKAKDDALTWNYPACAVLGFDILHAETQVVTKALLGCTDAKKSPPKKYPGIRNLLCNILRMSGQGLLFDRNPYVFIFPICGIEWTREWTGQGYDAIVICQSAHVAQKIGMTNVKIQGWERATLSEINTAAQLAATVCEFLAHSVLRKTDTQVNRYQDIGDRAAHERFRLERKISVPSCLSELPQKPVFKISFDGHDSNRLGNRHHAPDPMLLAFKSCNNWCRKTVGFRMLAGAEPEEPDDLSEEGQQNLQNYIAWQNEEVASYRHSEIMSRFGQPGGLSNVDPSR